MTSQLNEISEIFQRAGTAHHAAFSHVNGDDPEWPEWYADYVVKDLSRIFAMQLTAQEVALHLVNVSERFKKDKPSEPWTAYYADYFLGIYNK